MNRNFIPYFNFPKRRSTTLLSKYTVRFSVVFPSYPVWEAALTNYSSINPEDIRMSDFQLLTSMFGDVFLRYDSIDKAKMIAALNFGQEFNRYKKLKQIYDIDTLKGVIEDINESMVQDFGTNYSAVETSDGKVDLSADSRYIMGGSNSTSKNSSTTYDKLIAVEEWFKHQTDPRIGLYANFMSNIMLPLQPRDYADYDEKGEYDNNDKDY